tara:strand:- start:426 stop:908 length:483 start_codon:yes stop_codon:yes gene_type:complete
VEGLISNDEFYKLCDDKKDLPVKLETDKFKELATKKRKFGDVEPESLIFISGRAIQELSILINFIVDKEERAKEKLQKSEQVLEKALKSSTEDYIVHYILEHIASQSLRYEDFNKKLQTLKHLVNKILLAKENLPKPSEFRPSFLDGWISRLIESNNKIN